MVAGASPAAAARPATPAGGGGAAMDTVRVLHLIQAFQAKGHEYAKLDPLNLRAEGLKSRDRMGTVAPVDSLDYKNYGFTEADLERPLQLADFRRSEAIDGLMANADLNNDGQTTLQELLDTLNMIYTGTVGIEYLHLRDLERLNWIRTRVEQVPMPQPTKEERLHILERLSFADNFETFLARKHNTVK